MCCFIFFVSLGAGV